MPSPLIKIGDPTPLEPGRRVPRQIQFRAGDLEQPLRCRTRLDKHTSVSEAANRMSRCSHDQLADHFFLLKQALERVVADPDVRFNRDEAFLLVALQPVSPWTAKTAELVWASVAEAIADGEPRKLGFPEVGEDLPERLRSLNTLEMAAIIDACQRYHVGFGLVGDIEQRLSAVGLLPPMADVTPQESAPIAREEFWS